MKNIILALLLVILFTSLGNLLVGLGVVGGGGSSPGTAAKTTYEYQSLDVLQMDNIGFRSVAKEEGLEVSEAGEINFPKELVDKISKHNLLPRTISEVERDGGWEFVGATTDNYFIFRRPVK